MSAPVRGAVADAHGYGVMSDLFILFLLFFSGE